MADLKTEIGTAVRDLKIWTGSIAAAMMVAVALTLIACGPSKSEKMATFRQKCAATEFTPAQCQLLAELYAASIDAKDAADDAGLIAGAGVAVGAAGAARR